MSRIAVLTTLAVLMQTALAWWESGHLIVARIAYDFLSEEDAAALDKANSMLDILTKTSNIEALKYENNYPFVECAPFADTVKGEGYSFQAGWHFVNNPYLDQSQNITDYDFSDFNSQNVSSVTVDIINWLAHNEGYKNTDTYNDVMHYFDTEEEGESFSLRLLIHYFGDAHQPCHSITRVDSDYPTGDRGCNSVYLKSREGASNLHAVWDSIAYAQESDPKLPLSDNQWSRFGGWADEATSKYPLASSEYHTNDPYAWADENEAYASQVYGGVEKEGSLSDEYVSWATATASKRISFGGRRLANTIKYLYGSSRDESLFLQ